MPLRDAVMEIIQWVHSTGRSLPEYETTMNSSYSTGRPTELSSVSSGQALQWKSTEKSHAIVCFYCLLSVATAIFLNIQLGIIVFDWSHSLHEVF